MRVAPEVKHTLQRLSALISPESHKRRARLRNKHFTIVSNDCWGAEVYKDLNLPFTTPLIGTFMAGPCFMRMVTDCPRILRSPIAFSNESRYAYVRELKAEHGNFPTGVLDNGNVEVHFLHYANAEEAEAKWSKRVQRINDDQMFFKLSGDKDEFTDEDYSIFDALPLKHKIALSKAPHPELSCVVTVPDWLVDGKLMYERSIRRFDIVEWLNEP